MFHDEYFLCRPVLKRPVHITCASSGFNCDVLHSFIHLLLHSSFFDVALLYAVFVALYSAYAFHVGLVKPLRIFGHLQWMSRFVCYSLAVI